MFYSESLLSKKGPLARVWLAANLERKLSKAQFLQTSIEKSVGAIVGDDVAPMALRLSGQLLLGVVRIYSRKTKYLLDDCSDALAKLRTTFRAGNVDLVTSAAVSNPQQLTLSNTITELDLLLPDPSALLGLEPLPVLNIGAHTLAVKDITLPDLQDSIELVRGGEVEDDLARIGDDDLVLDTGEYLMNNPDALDDEPAVMPQDDDDYDYDQSIEIGRNNQLDGLDVENYGVELNEVDDGGLEIGGHEDDEELQKRLRAGETFELMDVPSMRQDEDDTLSIALENEIQRDRASATPTKKREPAKRKQKIDSVTELKSAFIKQMQTERTGLLRNESLIPRSRDGVALLSLYDKGIYDLIYKPSYLHESISSLLAPRLLPADNLKKRKKSAGHGDEDDEEYEDQQQSDGVGKKLHVDNEEQYAVDEELAIMPQDEDWGYDQGPIINDDDVRVDYSTDQVGDQDGSKFTSDDVADQNLIDDQVDDDVDDVDAVADSSQAVVTDVSRNTRQTVIQLRTALADVDSIEFQSLVKTHNRTDTVKFFFETLVLATKDAVEVSQAESYGTINIKAKESLYKQDWINDQTQQITGLTQVEASA
ncbi:Rec8 like protein-domain-containing protein [Lipomyces japonicus]|uniref:Rec8 like protein-domain-containing protein n=1 Tax=Lipomyces japonicus TaxID=56871 RepID=UPI0034CF98A9